MFRVVWENFYVSFLIKDFINILAPKKYYIRLKFFFCQKIALQILFCVTLRTLTDNYVHARPERKDLCMFVDSKKVLDSVWHVGLLNKLLNINVGRHFYDLIKSLYSTSNCSLKICQCKLNPLDTQEVYMYIKVAF